MIGIFDSGIGGLSIYLELKKISPDVSVIYFADSLNFPYGEKSQRDLEAITAEATKLLAREGADTIVVGCNSATVSVIDKLRSDFPDCSFVGIEPAVKLAEKMTKNGKIGLLATKKTVITHDTDRLIGNIQVYRHHSADLIDQIENDIESITDNDIISAVSPLVTSGVDTIVLGCTHFYFVAERIRALFPNIVFIEPASHVALQANRSLSGKLETGRDLFFVSGDERKFRVFLTNLLGDKDVDIRKI